MIERDTNRNSSDQRRQPVQHVAEKSHHHRILVAAAGSKARSYCKGLMAFCFRLVMETHESAYHSLRPPLHKFPMLLR